MIELQHGDCVKLLEQLGKDKQYQHTVSAIITDPPYNISRPNNFQSIGSASRIGMDFGEWDKGFNICEFISEAPPPTERKCKCSYL